MNSDEMTDVFGQAIFDFFNQRNPDRLWVHDEYGPNMEMPVKTYFRTPAEMPRLEQIALEQCRGAVLDIGAGAGSHVLALQERGLEVSALEISPKACAVMKERGVRTIFQEDIFKFQGPTFDTLLLMMNGIGLCSTPRGLRRFLKKAKTLLNEGGQLLFDSSDVAYLYEGEQLPSNRYYGEIKCRYEYKKQFSDWLVWLYIDQEYLKELARKEGFHTEILFEDGNDQYLARLTAFLPE